jgi:hypothetical protein
MIFFHKRNLFMIGFLIIIITETVAQKTINFEVLTGPVYNFPSKLIITQKEYQTIRHNAEYVSKPFHLPPYYDLRLSLWYKDSSAWGLKFTHHKIYLKNTTPEISRFEITHGYNILSITRIWKRLGFTWNTALGSIVANPESEIRGQHFHGGGLFNRGYYFAGIVGEGAVGRQFKITPNWYFSGEVRLTAAWAKVKVSNGYAEVPNLAVHFLVGTGYRIFTRQDKKWNWGAPRQ